MEVDGPKPSLHSPLKRSSKTKQGERFIVSWPEKLLAPPQPDPFWTGNASLETPITIDFGSCRIKAGFSNQNHPTLDFPSIFSRYKWGSTGIDDDDAVGIQTWVGNDVLMLPPAAKKIPIFDYNVPYHFDGIEYVLDHLFAHLLNFNNPHASMNHSSDTESEEEEEYDELLPSAKRRKLGSHPPTSSNIKSQPKRFYEAGIEHPVVMTEAPLIPRSVRNQMTQLMFECYGTSKLLFGIDSLFSLIYDHSNNYAGCTVTNCFSEDTHLKYNWIPFQEQIVPSSGLADENSHPKGSDLWPSNALVIGSGYESTHIMPVLDGKLDIHGLARIDLGGHHGTEYLNKSVLLQFPEHKAEWTKQLPSAPGPPGYAAAEAIKEKECIVALPDYLTMVRKLENDSNSGITTDFEHYLQLEYEPEKVETITDEERREHEEKKLLNAARMREMGRKKKEEKILEKQIRMGDLEQLVQDRSLLPEEEFEQKLLDAGFEEADFAYAGTGGPKDKILEEMSDSKRYIDRGIEDAVLNDRNSEGYQKLTLEEKLQTLDAKFPITLLDDSQLSEADLKTKKASMKLRQLTEIRIRKGHDRDMEKGKSVFSPNYKPPAGTTSSTSGSNITADSSTINDRKAREIVVHPDEPRQMAMLGLEDLQHQRSLILKRLQDRTAKFYECETVMKDAVDNANRATLADLLNVGSINTAGPSTTSGTGVSGVGSIASGVGSRAARNSKKNSIAMYSIVADEFLEFDEDGLDQLAAAGREVGDLTSIAANQLVETANSDLHAAKLLMDADKSLLELVDDEIIARLDPAALQRREAEANQIRLEINRIRIPELIFQPTLIGLEQQGVGETFSTLLSKYRRSFPSSELNLFPKMLSRVYLTGGNCSFKNISTRMFNTFAPELPAGFPLRIIQSSSPVYGAWKGASLFASNSHYVDKYFVSAATYAEEGLERIVERFATHFAANPALP